jgi:hypothetical protein
MGLDIMTQHVPPLPLIPWLRWRVWDAYRAHGLPYRLPHLRGQGTPANAGDVSSDKACGLRMVIITGLPKEDIHNRNNEQLSLQLPEVCKA